MEDCCFLKLLKEGVELNRYDGVRDGFSKETFSSSLPKEISDLDFRRSNHPNSFFVFDFSVFRNVTFKGEFSSASPRS